MSRPSAPDPSRPTPPPAAPPAPPTVAAPHGPPGQPPPGYGPPPPGYGPPGAPGGPGGRKVWPWLVGAAVLVLILIGGGVAAWVVTSDDDGDGSSDRAARDESADPEDADPEAEPEAGQCRDLPASAAEAETDASPIVDCSDEHTVQTYYVGEFSGDEADVDEAAQGCREELPGALDLGAEEAALTAYRLLFFQPTDEQWDDGERWYRCDLTLTAEADLLPLPTDGELVSDPLADEQAACMTDDYQYTPCSEEHAYRAYDTWEGDGETMPSDEELIAQAEADCDDAQTGSYYTWPSDSAWEQGDRLGVCWALDA